MSTLHKEIHFETEICEHLAAQGWLYADGDAAGYDRARNSLDERNSLDVLRFGIDMVGRWLATTGYNVEAMTAKAVHECGYFDVYAPSAYRDLDAKTVKELDVFASITRSCEAIASDSRVKFLRSHFFSEDELPERPRPPDRIRAIPSPRTGDHGIQIDVGHALAILPSRNSYVRARTMKFRAGVAR